VVAAYGASAWAPMLHGYNTYLAFAKMSPDFKNFLVAQGWTIPN
jgi:hypothetical protein